MDKTQFWRLIEDAKVKSGGECEEQAELLQSSLLLLSVEEIAAFDKTFNEFRAAAYRWDLSGAHTLINGGSDDGFEYFRWWLIGQGREMFESALAQPDDLADLIKDDIFWGDGQLECESIAYAAGIAYQEKTGRELPYDEQNASLSEPVGVKWEEDDLDAMFPKIAAKISAQE